MLHQRYKATIYFIFLFSFFSITINSEAKEKDFYINKAKEIISEKNDVPKEKLKVANERPVSYQFSGKKAHSVKFIDDQGKIIGLALDENGQELNEDELARENLEAKHAKYGKFDPSFFEKLLKEPEDKKVKALLSLKIPHYVPVQYPGGTLPGDPNITDDELKDLDKRAQEEYISYVAPIVDKVIEKLKEKGEIVHSQKTDNVLYVELSIKILREVQKWEEIKSISDDTKKGKPTLASARPSARINMVNSLGYTGAGIKVAQIEAGENGVGVRVATNNTNLPMTGITQDTTYACSSAGDHTTAVAGILKSINSTDKGVSTGVTLWASGSCNGDNYQLKNRAEAAVTQQNASVINMSWTCEDTTNLGLCSDWPGETTLPYERLVYVNHKSIVISAGNDGTTAMGDGTGKIYEPANGYNVLTVGSYDDRNNGNWNDDIMSDFSSWLNPASLISPGGNDREKPDVVAPGSSISSLKASFPWTWTPSGTSFAAPIVTGGSALLIQRASILGSWPEALKALILATARNNVGRDSIIPASYEDAKDGFGGVDFEYADLLLQGKTGGTINYGNYSCATLPNPYNITKNVTSIKPQRVIFTWGVNPDYPEAYLHPNIDLDITVYDPYGNYVGGSARYDGNVEGVYFTPSITGTYRVEVNRYRCDTTYNDTRFALGWTDAPATDIDSGSIYKLTNQCSQKVLDVSGGSAANGANVQQWTWANVNQQKWRIEDVGAGYYRLTAQHSGKVLEVANAQTTIGANVWQWPWLGGTNQQWNIINMGDGSKLIARHSGQALDVSNASTADGANVQQWVDNSTCAQRWKIEKL